MSLLARAILRRLPKPRVYRSELPILTAALMVADRARWIYCGFTLRPVIFAHVKFQVTTVGAGAQTMEVGWATSPAAPNSAAQVLTVRAVTGTVDDCVGSTGFKANTAAFTTLCEAGRHVWAFMRTNFATTQPTLFALGADQGMGRALQTVGAGVINTVGATYTGAIIAATTGSVGPAIELCLD